MKSEDKLINNRKVHEAILFAILGILAVYVTATTVSPQLSENHTELSTKLSAVETQAAIAKCAGTSINDLQNKINKLNSNVKVTQLTKQLDVPTLLGKIEDASKESSLNINSYKFSGNAASVKGQLHSGDATVMDDTAQAMYGTSSDDTSSSDTSSSSTASSGAVDSKANTAKQEAYVFEVAMGYDSSYNGIYTFAKYLEGQGYYFTVKQVTANASTDGKGVMSGKMVIDFYSLKPAKYGVTNDDGSVVSGAEADAVIKNQKTNKVTSSTVSVIK